MPDSKVYIGGFSYELGEHVFDIEELEELKGDKKLIEKFHEVGLKQYRTTSRPVLEIAEMAIRSFFSLNIIAPADIDAVIFCTNSFWCSEEFSEYPLTDFLQRLGLSYAYPIASSFSYCGNFLTGARTACNYIKTKEFENILLVVADRTADDITRIVPPMLSIGSDAASCCLLTSDKLFDLEISGISQTMDAKMGKLDAGKDFIAYTQGVARGVVGNIKNSLRKARVEKNDLTRVISNNYNRWVTPSMIRVADIPIEKVSLENIPRFAHAGASDICINMSDYLAASGNSKKEEILLLSTGPVMWGTAIVRSVSDQ